jgi:predicted nuclease with TOPRIM domain
MAGLIVMLVISTIIIVILAILLFKKSKQLQRYQGIANIEAEQERLQKESINLTNENVKLREEGRTIRDAVTNLQSLLASLKDEQELTEFGLYEPRYDFGASNQYKAELDAIRQKQKQMIADKKAVLWSADWTVHGSKAKGQSMMNQRTKLTLYAFNGECDSLILKVKYDNVERIRARIQKTYEDINRLSKVEECSINPDYLDLKIQEMHLVHEYQEKLQAEKEEQQRIREEMREEQRAQREIEQAQQEAEKEEERYRKALEKARQEMQRATGEKHVELEKEIERLNQMLAVAVEKRDRAISRAQMTRSGHVYVISNIGSFGENVYKIGMTRRLEPLDRVRELGDASVPFSFDVHAIIYADDAPALETMLHQSFDSNRINLVNPRKEFFRVTLDEIASIVRENHGEVEFTLKAEAAEYRQTKAIIANNDKTQTSKPHELYDEVLGISIPILEQV